jgi:hypothetical protein
MNELIEALIDIPTVGYSKNEYTIITPYRYQRKESEFDGFIVVYAKSLKDGTLFTDKGKTFFNRGEFIGSKAINDLIAKTNKKRDTRIQIKRGHVKVKTDTLIYDSEFIGQTFTTFLQTLINIHYIIDTNSN